VKPLKDTEPASRQNPPDKSEFFLTLTESELSQEKRPLHNQKKLDNLINFADRYYKSNSKEGVSSMEHFFTMSTIKHHSFMRWNNSAKAKKDEKAVTPIFDPCDLEEDSMERAFMVTALSA
jgi:hypothetical protein